MSIWGWSSFDRQATCHFVVRPTFLKLHREVVGDVDVNRNHIIKYDVPNNQRKVDPTLLKPFSKVVDEH